MDHELRVGCQQLAAPVCIHATGDMQPVICALQPAAMRKRKNNHALVGALSDAQKAIRREEDRVRQQKRSAKLKAQGLKKPLSDVPQQLHHLAQQLHPHPGPH
jgi:hypothetical protein